MQSIGTIRSLLREHGLVPRHHLGQNFLHDHNQLRRLVDAADVQSGEVIVEIGPGTGTLTEELLDRGANVIACEIDERLYDLINMTIGERYGPDRFVLVHDDCLASKHALSSRLLDAIGERSFRLVANLPYQITGPLIGTLVTDHHPAVGSVRPSCCGMFVTVQREAAWRIMAKPNTKEYGPLAVLTHLLADSRQLGTLSPRCFWPEPKVMSSMIAIEPTGEPPILDVRTLVDFLSRLFQQRRKQLGRILGSDVAWPEGIDRTMRPEDLSPEDFLVLAGACGGG